MEAKNCHYVKTIIFEFECYRNTNVLNENLKKGPK